MNLQRSMAVELIEIFIQPNLVHNNNKKDIDRHTTVVLLLNVLENIDSDYIPLNLTLSLNKLLLGRNASILSYDDLLDCNQSYEYVDKSVKLLIRNINSKFKVLTLQEQDIALVEIKDLLQNCGMCSF